MSHLNSVLIEGIIISDAKFEKEGVCRFSIMSNRWNDNEEIIDGTSITIEAKSKLAELCKRYACNGRGVRAVGSLKQISIYDSEHKIAYSQIIIEAEHIEFRKEFN